MQHVFRYLLLLVVGIVPIHFMDIEDKMSITIGWIAGATLAFILGNILIRYMKKKAK